MVPPGGVLRRTKGSTTNDQRGSGGTFRNENIFPLEPRPKIIFFMSLLNVFFFTGNNLGGGNRGKNLEALLQVKIFSERCFGEKLFSKFTPPSPDH